MTYLKRAFAWIFAFVLSDRFFDLLITSRVPAYLQHHRLGTVQTRIRLVSAIFAGLTLLWVPLDMMAFPQNTWISLAILRVVIAGIFVVIAISPIEKWGHLASLVMLSLMLANPLILHGVAHHLLLEGMPDQPLGQINANLYAALPFVVIVGLGLFPLVAVESALLSLPIFAMAVFLPMSTNTFSIVDVSTEVWILGLLLGVAMLAGMIQAYYMDVLLKRANHDPLTGALTRRSGTEILEFMFRLSCDKQAPMTVLFFDIDNFKSINDVYGHDMGDEMLRRTVDTLNDKTRELDAVVRWGGEEFVVVMGDTCQDGAIHVLDRITQDWLCERPDGEPLTASIGLAERTQDGCETWEQLIELADQRMYQAKQSGKARYSIAPRVANAA